MADEGGSSAACAASAEAPSSSSAAGRQVSTSPSPPKAHAPNGRNSDAADNKVCLIVQSPDSLSAIKAAQSAFECPEGYKPYVIRKCEMTRSPMYRCGVRVVSTSTEGATSNKNNGPTVRGLFFCMASSKCRERRVRIKISNKNTTPATTHLSEVHQIVSTRGKDVKKK